MSVVFVICGSLFGVAALLSVVRIVIGPTTLNRAIAVEMLVAMLVGSVGLHAAVTRSTTSLPILVVLALVGFVGSVSIARFVGQDDKEDHS